MAVAARRRGGARGCRSGAISPASEAVALPLPEIQIFGGGAHAGPARRHPGLHGHLPGRRDLRRGARLDRRGLSRRRRADGRGGQAPGRRRRRRLVAGLRHQRGGAGRCWCGRSSAPASRPASRSRSRSTSRPPSSAATAATASASRTASSTRDGMIEMLRRLARPLSDRLDRGPAGRGRRRRASPASPRRAARGPGRRRRLPGHQRRRGCAQAAPDGRLQRRAAQAEPGAAR